MDRMCTPSYDSSVNVQNVILDVVHVVCECSVGCRYGRHVQCSSCQTHGVLGTRPRRCVYVLALSGAKDATPIHHTPSTTAVQPR